MTIASAMFGKLAITASYGTVYVFSTEQFPTVIRNAGLGAGSTSARVGSILAPLINLTVPIIIFLIQSEILNNFQVFEHLHIHSHKFIRFVLPLKKWEQFMLSRYLSSTYFIF